MLRSAQPSQFSTYPSQYIDTPVLAVLNFVILPPWLVLHAGFYFMLLFSFYLDDEAACGDELFDELEHQVDVKEGNKVTVACPGGCIKMKMVSLFVRFITHCPSRGLLLDSELSDDACHNIFFFLPGHIWMQQ